MVVLEQLGMGLCLLRDTWRCYDWLLDSWTVSQELGGYWEVLLRLNGHGLVFQGLTSLVQADSFLPSPVSLQAIKGDSQ